VVFLDFVFDREFAIRVGFLRRDIIRIRPINELEHLKNANWRVTSDTNETETDIFAKVVLAKRIICFQLLNNISSFLLFRLFGTKCAKCSRSVTKNDFVMRAKNQIYHIDCFRCIACSRQLVPGDEFALREDGLFCKEDNEIVEKATATAQAAHARGGQRSSSQSSGTSVCFCSQLLLRCGRSCQWIYQNLIKLGLITLLATRIDSARIQGNFQLLQFGLT